MGWENNRWNSGVQNSTKITAHKYKVGDSWQTAEGQMKFWQVTGTRLWLSAKSHREGHSQVEQV